MKQPHEQNRYAAMGMAAMLPGLQYALELMQHQLDDFRAELARLQGGEAPRAKIGRPKGSANKAKSGWENMTAEERSAEMKRRQAVAKANKATHPRDPNHPGHDEWVANLRKIQLKHWNKQSPAQKEARIAAMEAGKKKARQAKKKAMNAFETILERTA